MHNNELSNANLNVRLRAWGPRSYAWENIQAKIFLRDLEHFSISFKRFIFHFSFMGVFAKTLTENSYLLIFHVLLDHVYDAENVERSILYPRQAVFIAVFLYASKPSRSTQASKFLF